MARIVDEKQQENLNRNHIEIQTKYMDGDTVLVKSTNEANSDPRSINNGIILEKIFLKDGKPLKRLDQYDSRVQYCFVVAQEELEEVTCPNCGYTGKGKDFVDGCPYCRTVYNIDYSDKSLGTKYYYDYVMKSDNYIGKTFIVDIIFSFLAMLVYILSTGRTFNGYDIAKVIVGGILLGMLFFAVFYALDAYILMLPVKNMKEKQNQKQMRFWTEMSNLGVEKNKLYNNFHYELRNLLYKNPNIIDYDVVDYNEYRYNNTRDSLEVTISYDIRLVSYENGQIQTENTNMKSRLIRKPVKIQTTKEGINLIQCSSCGASVSITDRVCSYCGSRINAYQEWFIQ